ncbi:MAG: MarR family transcriptional regulator [Polyangiaceae bacterium]|nr:MarR family transcriptional regulator [Polyangiaceae bacterium]
MGWQRSIDKVLRPIGLTHTRFLVLDAAAQAFERLDDAVSQAKIAEVAGIDEASTSRIARRLEQDGLIDRGPDGVDARYWRVIVTREGYGLLRLARPVVDAAAARFFARGA